MALRKELAEAGFDAGAVTVHTHLARRHPDVPSVSTIWRVLKDRGFVTPQPHKRPRSSLVRFVAELPNECWQADMTPLVPGRRGPGWRSSTSSMTTRGWSRLPWCCGSPPRPT